MFADPLGRLSDAQREQLAEYAQRLHRFNDRINLVSRNASLADVEEHVTHCLALAVRPFPDRSTVADWGTGGGLPLIPLAIAFPGARFIGIDAVGKKVHAVTAMARRLGLTNVEAWSGRAEAWDGALDLSVSRATAPLAELWRWHQPHRREESAAEAPPPDAWPQGALVALKGGDLTDEIAELHTVAPDLHVEIERLGRPFAEPEDEKVRVVVTQGASS